jgi:membrane carboxypeptidase/penicillin-binding protein
LLIHKVVSNVIYSHPLCCSITGNEFELSMIQEGLRGVVRIPSGTAHALDARTFPIPVMGKTGTTNDYRDALFVGSTYGRDGITVAVRIGFDDNHSLGGMETGGRTALPVFREIILRVYQEKLVGPAPQFPAEMEENIDAYLRGDLPLNDETGFVQPFGAPGFADDGTQDCSAKLVPLSTYRCESTPGKQRNTIFARRNESGRLILTNE